MTSISQQIWDMKYRLKEPQGKPIDNTVEDTWRRVAKQLAEFEQDPAHWENLFYSALENFKFLPAGRIIAGAGTKRRVTLFNCFVMGNIQDDMEAIFDNLKEAALTMQQGGGIGYNFSSLRPVGTPVKGVGADASGPLSFMDVWDAMCRTIMSAGHRRGAMMAAMRCNHPDIEEFITAKKTPDRLRMFNLSVLVTDDFMTAVKNDLAWDLSFNDQVYKSIRARDLWDKIIRATYSYAEPGVIFIDRVNRLNNLNYCENISATNPCGEQPLPPYGACLLGSINLAKLVKDAFTENAHIDLEELSRLVFIAVRMLDNVIDASKFPLPEQEHEAKSKRRIGLGITGLADALIFCCTKYGSAQAISTTQKWLKTIQKSSYLASTQLAKEKGSFPLFNKDAFLRNEMINQMGEAVRSKIAKNGLRNGLLTSVAPTGTISLFADNVSSGLEPVFSFTYKRLVTMPNGERREQEISDYAYKIFKKKFGDEAELPDYFVDAESLQPIDHLRMQSAVQKFVDSSISKTINVPENMPFEDFKNVYDLAFESGCKGCTTYRPNEVTGSVMSKDSLSKSELSGPQSSQITSKKDEDTNPSDIIYMTKPLNRPETLTGNTYKIKWPETDHAIYITINDIITDGRTRPFEVFINSKNMEHYAWTVALTRMISAVFRRGGDVSFVVEELKAVFDPRGGYWLRGQYVPSLLAAIGEVIEKHLIKIKFIADPSDTSNESHNAQGGGMSLPNTKTSYRGCPKCAAPSLINQEGCDMCVSCGFSKCA